MLKSYQWVGFMGQVDGLCDFSVSRSPLGTNSGFWTGLDLVGVGHRGFWDKGFGARAWQLQKLLFVFFSFVMWYVFVHISNVPIWIRFYVLLWQDRAWEKAHLIVSLKDRKRAQERALERVLERALEREKTAGLVYLFAPTGALETLMLG